MKNRIEPTLSCNYLNDPITGIIRRFVIESNRIEGITREPTLQELVSTELFLNHKEITIETLQGVVDAYAPTHVFRGKIGLNVRVGNYTPPPGGHIVVWRTTVLLNKIKKGSIDPYNAHCEYESIHPFTDGNGRSGRVLWAWHMRHIGLDPFSLPFLHRFYYQALDHSDTRNTNLPNPG